jgi:5-methylthioadenosine/S-adenosylhomocysteine deaminase
VTGDDLESDPLADQRMTSKRQIDLIVAGGHVLTMDADRPEIAPGSIAVHEGLIVAVGGTAEIAAAFDAADMLDASGCAVLPGLVDAYAHAGHGLIRGLMHPSAGWPASLYWSATTPAWWRAEADLAALERLKAGVTTGLSVIGATPARLDDIVFAEENAKAYEAAGLAVVLAAGPPDPVFPHIPEPFSARHWRDDRWIDRPFTMADTVANTIALIDRWHGAGDGQISVALAPPYLFGRHVPHRRTPNRLPDASDAPVILAHARDMRAIADERKVLIQTHMFRGSIDYARRHFGAAETERLLGDGDVLVCHANGMVGAEAEMLGAHRCGIGTVAFTHENLWYGMAAIPELVQAGCRVAVTTDGAAPYASLDLWREPARAAWNQWLAADTQAIMPPETLLRMITIDAAGALGLDRRKGSLEPGKDADIVLVDLAAPHFGPIADLAQSLVFYATAADVRDVVVRGRLLLRERKAQRVDEAAILDRAREEAARARSHVDMAPYGRGSDRWRGSPLWPEP